MPGHRASGCYKHHRMRSKAGNAGVRPASSPALRRGARLAYHLLERAHARDEWHLLRLPAECTYDWFVEVQQRAGTLSASAQYVLLLTTVRIAQQLAAAGDGNVEAAVELAANAAAGVRSSGQQCRRLYRTANLVWHRLKLTRPPPGGRLALPLALPPLGRPAHLPCSPVDHETDSTRVFSPEEADALIAAAAGLSRRAEVLLRLLFTTGLRIGAAARITWGQLLLPDSARGQRGGDEPLPLLPADVRQTATVCEKGNTVRHILLTNAVRAALASAYNESGGPARSARCLVAGVRTLRNDFYRACARAGVSGPHCHPHRARHSLAHMLWAHGNPVAVIAKFLGHRSIATTNQHYLRLSFAEVLSHIRLPWATPAAADVADDGQQTAAAGRVVMMASA